MSKQFAALLPFLISPLLATTAFAQTYVGQATYPDVDFTETIFPFDPDTGRQIEVTCSGTSSYALSGFVVTVSPPSIKFTIESMRTNVTGTDPRFCADSEGSFPFEVANVSATAAGVSGQNTAGTIFADLLFNSDGSALEGTVLNTRNLDGQQVGQALLARVDTFEINATGMSEDSPGGGFVTTSDWSLVFRDRNNDGILQVGEIIRFSGTTVTNSMPETFIYDAMVGSPNIPGISGESGGFDACCWWFSGPVTAGEQDGWYPRRWTYELTPVLVTPAILLSELATLVVDLNLEAGIGNALDSKLQNVRDAFDRAQSGDNPSALRMIFAFIESVEAQRDKKITGAQADELIAVARSIIAMLL